MRTLLIITLVLMFGICRAQAPYTGGSGDGHAMGELVLRPLAVREDVLDGLSLYPTLMSVGCKLQVEGNTNLQLANYKFRIITITGTVLTNKKLPDSGSITTDKLVPGLYLVELSDGNRSKTFRITVIQ